MNMMVKKCSYEFDRSKSLCDFQEKIYLQKRILINRTFDSNLGLHECIAITVPSYTPDKTKGTPPVRWYEGKLQTNIFSTSINVSTTFFNIFESIVSNVGPQIFAFDLILFILAYLHVIRTCIIKACMSSNCGHNPPLTIEVAALERQSRRSLFCFSVAVARPF